MIPVKYTGNTTGAQWTSVANPEAAGSDWYDYANKQWANAITVKKEALAKYKGQTKVVDQADILGYWVYIPRYAYEVMRRDGTDKPVTAQNFVIHFEKVTDPKRYPATCSEPGKDYRTRCDLNRDYIKGQLSDNGTWFTHPAFTFGNKELNGIWFAKFETTWNGSQPTVLPNEVRMAGYYAASSNIGRMYTTAKTFGVADDKNVGGNVDYQVPTQNNHHLAKLSSRMVNNNDWGAATYLSASKYGAGYNGVQINSQHQRWDNSYNVTGCGPQASGYINTYDDSGTLGTQSACSSSNLQRAYNGTLGQLASTTNNPTGIYDMSGGGWEYVAASYSDNSNNSSTKDFNLTAHPPYVNIYRFSDLRVCTFDTCGGQALYETNLSNSDDSVQWNGDRPFFVGHSDPWLGRGGGYNDDSRAGLFYSKGDYNIASRDTAFRVALAPAPQD